MAKFHGKIGYATFAESETSPGVYSEVITEVDCKGDIIRNSNQWNPTDSLNDNIVINNQLSIVASLSNDQIPNMRYAEFSGVKWKIKSFEIRYPRIILNIGEVYNG